MCFSILTFKNNHNKLDKSPNQKNLYAPALSKMFKEVSVCFMREVPNLLKVNIPANLKLPSLFYKQMPSIASKAASIFKSQ